MHAPYAAQYCVIGGSGAGSGGSFTPDAAAVCAAPAAAVPEAPLSALVADAGVAAAVVAVAVVELAVFVAAAVVAVLTPAPLAAGAAAATGMLAPGGVAEKLLEGKGGRDGAPVDDVLVAAGLRGGSCDSCAMLILVCLLAVA
ncbi:hypothetical protein P3T25_003511 [Paraburkholderia sp. GAS32]